MVTSRSLAILLERNVEVNSRNDDGPTPLLTCIQHGHLTLRGYCWTTMRMCTCMTTTETLHCTFGSEKWSPRGCSELLERNAEVNSRNNHGSTPLLLASEYGTLMLCSYCWTTMLMCMCATPMATLHYIAQRSEVSSRLLGYYSSSMWRSIPGTTRDRPHYT
jgi:hypothetical protein